MEALKLNEQLIIQGRLEPQKLADIIWEIMAILTRRRELEQRIDEGQTSAADRIELKTINQQLE